jgi:DNA mismatch repair ATPase MutS
MALRDSLQDGESYFIVEIKSLRRILDASGKPSEDTLHAEIPGDPLHTDASMYTDASLHTDAEGKKETRGDHAYNPAHNPVLCCIDEVLRGTNTVERIAASAEILRCFAQTKTLCFAATHDLELTGLLEDVYDNYHFSEQIVDGDVCFSYKLKTGPSNSCNAIALLDSLGYDRTLVEKARQRADRFLSLGSWQQNDQNV